MAAASYIWSRVQPAAGTGLMHGSFHVDDPGRFSRDWFGWADAIFCEPASTCAGAACATSFPGTRASALSPQASPEKRPALQAAICPVGNSESLKVLYVLRPNTLKVRRPGHQRAVKLTEQEIAEAELLIDRLSRNDLEGDGFTDRYTEAVEQLIEAKREHKEPRTHYPSPTSPVGPLVRAPSRAAPPSRASNTSGTRSPHPPPGTCPTHPLSLFFLLWGVVRGRRGDVGLATTAGSAR
ncbi:glycoside hydrolase family 125 protein [Streptomyces mirabilis]|uniref:glycoside hydrolase family 125 protein n=1 Tax=Streptomyces mirabilis TaxID=68239 RepID=UPI0036CEFC4E